MGLEKDLGDAVEEIFYSTWEITEGQTVPGTDDLRLRNHGIELKATVLYADLADSTDIVDTLERPLAAELYKTYLHCAAKIITREKGVITAYDGDRIMAVFLGDLKNTRAVRTALKINYAVNEIINPKLESYLEGDYELEHGIGIDSSRLLVARTGIRGSNDLVWVGRAANYAAKLCALRKESYSIYITDRVYNAMNASVTFDENENDMWRPRRWTRATGTVYRSSYNWGGV